MGGMMMSFTMDVTIGPERRTDDDSHREVENVTLHYKCFEFFQHVGLPIPISVVEIA